MRIVAVVSGLATVVVAAGCNLLPVPRLSEIERDDESGRRLVTTFSYDDDGHIVGVEKKDSDDGDEEIETWELTWEDRGFDGTPLVRVVYEQRLNDDVVRELDLAIEANIADRTQSATDDETGDEITVTSVDGNIATIVGEDDDGTSTTTFTYELGNLKEVEVERDNDEGDDVDGRIELDYLSDSQENIGEFTITQGDSESTVELSYDDDARLEEQVLKTTLADGRKVVGTALFDYDDEGRIDTIEHRGTVDDSPEVVIGESSFSYDEGDVTGVDPTPNSIFFFAPLFNLKGGTTDNIGSSSSEFFLFPSW